MTIKSLDFAYFYEIESNVNDIDYKQLINKLYISFEAKKVLNFFCNQIKHYGEKNPNYIFTNLLINLNETPKKLLETLNELKKAKLFSFKPINEKTVLFKITLDEEEMVNKSDLINFFNDLVLYDIDFSTLEENKYLINLLNNVFKKAIDHSFIYDILILCIECDEDEKAFLNVDLFKAKLNQYIKLNNLSFNKTETNNPEFIKPVYSYIEKESTNKQNKEEITIYECKELNSQVIFDVFKLYKTIEPKNYFSLRANCLIKQEEIDHLEGLIKVLNNKTLINIAIDFVIYKTKKGLNKAFYNKTYLEKTINTFVNSNINSLEQAYNHFKKLSEFKNKNIDLQTVLCFEDMKQFENSKKQLLEQKNTFNLDVFKAANEQTVNKHNFAFQLEIDQEFESLKTEINNANETVYALNLFTR